MMYLKGFLFIINFKFFIYCWPEFHLYSQKNPLLLEKVDSLNELEFVVYNYTE